MKIEISYKTDAGEVPYCAYTTWVNGQYCCQWSSKSFKEARDKLVKAVSEMAIREVPPTETVEINCQPKEQL